MFKRFRPSPSKIIPIIIFIILAFTYRDVLHSMVLIPLAYLIFLIKLTALSIGQQTLWISFVVFSIMIAIFSLAMGRETQPEENVIEHKYPTRLQTWIKTVRCKDRSHYFKWNLAQDLSNLLIEAIAYHQGISQQQVRQLLEGGELDLPPDIRAYLQISQKPFTHIGLTRYKNGTWLLRIWDSITGSIASYTNTSPLDIDHERIIHYLEDYLGTNVEIREG